MEINNKITTSDEISLKDLLLKLKEWYQYTLSKWKIILLMGILGGSLGYVYAYFTPPIYTATTSFVLEDSGTGAGLGNLGGLASMVGIDVGGGGGIFQGDNILELYKSRKMIERAMLTEINYSGKTRLLIDHYVDFNHLKELWAKKLKLKDIKFGSDIGSNRLKDSLISSIITEVRTSLNVLKPDKKLSIIKVEVQSENEFFAKMFNEQIVKNVNDFYIQTKTKKSLANVAILQQKTDSVRAVMNGAIYSAAAVADATPNLNPTRQVQRIAPVQRSQFSAETNKAILGELVKNLEMSKISVRKETPLIQVIDSPILPLDKKKLSKLKCLILVGGLFGFFTVVILGFRKLLSDITK